MSEPIVCRCCLSSEGALRSLTSECDWTDARESYRNMLLQTLNVELIGVEQLVAGGICDVCIGRLIDATTFRRQVLFSEQEFLKLYGEIKSEIVLDIKELHEMSDGEKADESPAYDSDYDSKDEIKLSFFAKTVNSGKRKSADSASSSKRLLHEVNANTSIKAGRRRRATHAKPTRLRQKQVKEEPETETEENKSNSLAIFRTRRAFNVNATSTKPSGATSSLRPGQRKSKKLSKQAVGVSRSCRVVLDNSISDKAKHRINSAAIIMHSNAVPFNYKYHEGYSCSAVDCTQRFSDPADLRRHSLSEHMDRIECYREYEMKEDMKVDTTGLSCTICSAAFEQLSSLKEHLRSAHDKKIFGDAPDRVMEFKLTRETPLRCALCPQRFDNFKLLHQHMNCHYNNHVCSECGHGFVTLRRLKKHEARHAKGEFRCDQCAKVFSSKPNLWYHIKGAHKKKWQLIKCPHCPEVFVHHYKRERHMTEAHNATKVEHRCKTCDKTFVTKYLLAAHHKKDHVGEIHCTDSSHSCRDRGELVKIECNVCNKMFSTKQSLRRHQGKMHHIPLTV